MLDLGCGEGYCARNYLELGAKSVHGVDISTEMVSLAQATTAAVNATFECSSISDFATQIEMHAGYYDLVTAVFVSNYLDSDELREMVRVAYECLSPGGEFILLHPHPHLPYHRQSTSAGLRFDVEEDSSYFDSVGESHRGRIIDLQGNCIEVRLVHHTLDELFRNIITSGFRLSHFRELRLEKEIAVCWSALEAISHHAPLHVMLSGTKE